MQPLDRYGRGEASQLAAVGYKAALLGQSCGRRCADVRPLFESTSIGTLDEQETDEIRSIDPGAARQF